MALQAETLVEEWFNRNGYFTIRGIKDKIDEIYILAIKNRGQNKWECIHCEVQVGIRPVIYICRLTNQLAAELGVKTSSAKLRTEAQIATCAKQWVVTKFISQKKQQVRLQLNPNSNWSFLLVHGNVKESKELYYISLEGVELLSFRQILNDLCNKQTELDFSGSSAGDLVEIINFIQN